MNNAVSAKRPSAWQALAQVPRAWRLHAIAVIVLSAQLLDHASTVRIISTMLLLYVVGFLGAWSNHLGEPKREVAERAELRRLLAKYPDELP